MRVQELETGLFKTQFGKLMYYWRELWSKRTPVNHQKVNMVNKDLLGILGTHICIQRHTEKPPWLGHCGLSAQLHSPHETDQVCSVSPFKILWVHTRCTWTLSLLTLSQYHFRSDPRPVLYLVIIIDFQSPLTCWQRILAVGAWKKVCWLILNVSRQTLTAVVFWLNCSDTWAQITKMWR